MNKPTSNLVSREKCPWCGSRETAVLLEIRYDQNDIACFLTAFYTNQGCYEQSLLNGEMFVLMECKQCGFVYQQRIPGFELMERLYGVWINPKKSYEVHERCKSIEYYEYRAAHLCRLAKRFPGRAPCTIKVLDFSMGWGQWARIAAALGFQVFGTEFVAEKREHGKRFGINVLDEDALEGHGFDIVHVDQVLEHLPEPRATLNRLCQLMKPGGLISLGVPFGGDIRERLHPPDWAAEKTSPRSLMAIHPLEHINCFNRELLVKALTDQGFRVVDTAQGSTAQRMLRKLKSTVGALVRRTLNQQRPPLTIDIVAVREVG